MAKKYQFMEVSATSKRKAEGMLYSKGFKPVSSRLVKGLTNMIGIRID
tara:strand:+ start:17 stop:160 length:144 start_codon:yes stop_codon:yes gene_type:complete